MAEKDAVKEVERIYIVPLRRAKIGPTSRAAPRAVDDVRRYLMKHMKVEEKNVWIDDSLNRELWAHGKFWIPKKIRIRAVKFDDGVVEATLPEIGEKKSRRELLKEEKEKKTPILRREEEKPAEAATGAEDYEITPTGEGEVKIKKKKAPREKEEKPEEEKKEKKPAKEKEPEPEKEAEPEEPEQEEEEKTKEKPETPKKPAAKKTAAKKKPAAKKAEK